MRHDPAHVATDKEIEKIEKQIAKEYRQAHKEVSEKLEDYLSRFEKKDAKWQEWVKDGSKTEKEYIEWRKGQILVGERWKELRDTLAQDYANASQIALSICKEHAPDVYALNHNYATFEVEKGSGLDTSYTLYSRESVERMYRDHPKLYHNYGKAVAKEIKAGKQKAWDRKRIQSVLMQGLLQGESIPKLTKRLELVTKGDHNAAIRNARTMMTGVQNAGRTDAYDRANKMGIPVRKQWLATVDGRTRHWHRQLDGVVVDNDEPFENEFGKIMFPGDPEADGANVYNCRCTLLAAIKGFELDVTDPSIRPMPKLKDMTYDEWKHEVDNVKTPRLKDMIEADASKYSGVQKDALIYYAENGKFPSDLSSYQKKKLQGVINQYNSGIQGRDAEFKKVRSSQKPILPTYDQYKTPTDNRRDADRWVKDEHIANRYTAKQLQAMDAYMMESDPLLGRF